MEQPEIKRSELYQLVWQEPMIRLAKKYGVSDVALAKLCRKHNIPCPPRGYWAQKQFGKEPAQLALPDPENDEAISMWACSDAPEPAEPSEVDDETTRMVAAEKTKEMEIFVAESLRGAHELVHQANQELQGAECDGNRLIVRPKKAVLDVVVSKAALRRALIILDALIKALESRGHTVTAGPQAVVNGVNLTFGIEEKLETVREQNDDDIDLDSPYSFGHSRFDVKRVPSGKLALRIGDAESRWSDGVRRTWRDTEKHGLETQLNKVVAGMIRLAAHVKWAKEEAAKRAELARQEEAARQEVARQRAEKRKLQKQEQARLDELLQQAKNWRKSQTIRGFVEAVRQAHTAQGPINPDVLEWIEWATTHADRFDPIARRRPSILDEKIPDEPESRYGYGRSW